MKTHFHPAVPSRRPGGRALHSPSIWPSPALPAGRWRLPAALVAAAWLAGLGAQADSLVPLGFLQDAALELEQAQLPVDVQRGRVERGTVLAVGHAGSTL